MDNIQNESIDKGQPTLITISFGDLFHAAKVAKCRLPGFVLGKSTSLMFFCQHLEMVVHLVIKSRIAVTRSQRSANSRQQLPNRLHDSLSSSPLMTATMRAQCFDSAARCFSPARVIL